ncbi:3-deoxy-7-phosphoheptulonate synthase [Actinokineospora auranticolor]|uniref:3-deoxy-D-arabinoheptulosonate-7-phosphate synthase n=1 Tax=Actinokineospora auranticolor TaxID=155976 RepID=A0A2S6GKF5_9PSEU|nr:3-deoxy-7-phosphoheptulonate synthase [Actinokineospora auranticolor]PPK65670.1 3-deoxy-D-arabinoheptulosonate-7-phosphate synthase [Actinokineospora auranticolor]
MSGLSLYSFAVDTPATATQQWLDHFDTTGTTATLQHLGSTPVIVAHGPGTETPAPDNLVAPVAVVAAGGDFRLGRRELRPEGTVVRVGGATVGDGSLNVFAGPCAVENRQQLLDCADVAEHYGAVGLRGGAFKPRTSPYSFQGLKWAGLELLAEARAHTGLPILTEVLDPRHVERVAATADGLQIGARNMQNFELLSEAGKSGRPVVLKRGFGCTVDETLAAAEYILAQGNDQVILCERGIRTFEHATRFTLDISAVALMKQRSHLPVMVDPSHSVGIPALVEPVSLAAAAAGADALLIDVHVAPEQALCDGKQALLPDDFGVLMGKLELLSMGLSRKLAGVVGAHAVLAER